jgi:hypothetical protein
LRQGDRRQLPSRQGLILSAIRRDDQPGNFIRRNQMTHVNLTLWLKAIAREMRAEADGPRKDLLRALYVAVVKRLPD